MSTTHPARTTPSTTRTTRRMQNAECKMLTQTPPHHNPPLARLFAPRSLRYWLNVPGIMSWVATILFRVLQKLLVDYTVMVQLRRTYEQPSISQACVLPFLTFLLFLLSSTSPHLFFSDPNEVGGSYWISSLLLGQTTSFVSVYLFLSRASERQQDQYDTSSATDLWSLIVLLEVSFAAFFAIFLVSIKREFIVTFFSTVTAKKFNQERFRNATTDHARYDLLTNHHSYYDEIRGEVKKWVEEKYYDWVEDEPEWFTDRVKASIPKDMIPKFDVDVQREKKKKRMTGILSGGLDSVRNTLHIVTATYRNTGRNTKRGSEEKTSPVGGGGGDSPASIPEKRGSLMATSMEQALLLDAKKKPE